MSNSIAPLFLLSLVGATGIASIAWADLSRQSDEALMAELEALEAEAASLSELPEESPFGRANAFLGYSSDFGSVVSASLGLNRFLTEGQSLQFSGERSEDGSRLGLVLRNTALFQDRPEVHFGLNYLDRKSDETFTFDTRSRGVRLGATWGLQSRAEVTSYAVYAQERISNVGSFTSPLIQADAGERHRRGLGVDYQQHFGAAAKEEGRWSSLHLSAEAGRLSGGGRYSKFLFSGDTGARLRGGWGWSAGLRAGALDSSGAPSRIGDRFMSGSAMMRGFDYGGIGPRDLSVAQQPVLGGERYGALRLDLYKEAALGLPENMKLGAFWDAGALWQGPAGQGSDASAQLRSAAGVSLSIQLGLAEITLELAEPIEKESYDRARFANLRVAAHF